MKAPGMQGTCLRRCAFEDRWQTFASGLGVQPVTQSGEGDPRGHFLPAFFLSEPRGSVSVQISGTLSGKSLWLMEMIFLCLASLCFKELASSDRWAVPVPL